MSAERQAVQLGPFAISARLGVGGMGEVFRARRSGGAVAPELALKLIRGEHVEDPHFRQLFVREARIGALLDHPNVVRLLDVGEIDGIPYLAMEYVDGVSLDRLLGTRLSAAEVVHVARSLAAALDYIHRLEEDGRALRLVHRDVSPANILVARDGVVKLGDFGIAKLHGSSLTGTNEVKGKRAYMAPEQLVGGPIDHRADVFSLGAVLYRLLRGELLFQDVAEWLEAGAPRPAGDALSSVIATAVQPDAEARFSSAGELARALAAAAPAGDGAMALAARVDVRITESPALAAIDQVILADLASAVGGDGTLVQRPARSAALSQEVPQTKATGRRRALVGVVAATAVLGAGALWRMRAGGDDDDRGRDPAAVHDRPSAIPSAPPPSPVAPAVGVTPDGGPPPTSAPSRPRAARGARKPDASGFLTLDTEPWAKVYLAGREIGTTPFHRVKLPAGRHRLVLDVQGRGRRRALTVTVAPGAELRRSVDLR